MKWNNIAIWNIYNNEIWIGYTIQQKFVFTIRKRYLGKIHIYNAFETKVKQSNSNE